MREDFSRWVEITVRLRDLDPMNHVNSAIYFTYFEVARVDYFSKVRINELKVPRERGPAVISQTCNYRQQVFFPNTVEVGIRCKEIREKAFIVGYEIYIKGTDTLAADGETVMAWVDYTVPKAIPLPEELRKGIENLEGRSFDTEAPTEAQEAEA